jgi:light-dependent protochlorophyllide reductase
MTGRVIIVTGANTGLGFEVARNLCEGGNDVILACRNEERGNRAVEKIKRQNPNALATYMQLDLASSESIRKFVDDFRETGKKLNVLVNNAGILLSPKDLKRQYTEENFELTMGTNHLGHFLLTNLLLEQLKATGGEEGGDARVINVSSALHDVAEALKRRSNIFALDFDNFFLFNEATYNSIQAYKNSKVAGVMFTYELARRLEGTGVTVNCVNPGFIPGTELYRVMSRAQKFFSRYILHGMLRFAKITRSVQQGASAICTLVTEEKYKEATGHYYSDGAETKSSEESLDEEKQKKLWEVSGGYVKLEGYEPIEVVRPIEEEKKEKEKKEEGEKDGEAKPAEEGENKTDEAKTEEKNDEKKEESADEGKKEGEDAKVEETKEEPKKEEVKVEDNKEAEEKAEETKVEEKEEAVEKKEESTEEKK